MSDHSMPKHKQSKIPPLSIIYRRIAISFVVLTVLLAGIIVFFSMAKATVVITPSPEIRSAEFLVNIISPQLNQEDASAVAKGEIRGLYEEKIISEDGQFEASGIIEKQGQAEGVINVINTTSAAQTLVAETRFLSSENILFRAVERVVVPAKGSIAVRARSDQPGSAGDIGPTRFTIPGLNTEKQKLIYGESKTTFIGGAQSARVVTADDLELARTAVVEKAETKLRSEFEKSPAAALGGIFSTSDAIEIELDAKKGDERRTFTARAKIKAQFLAYDKAELKKLALEKVLKNVSADRELVKFNQDDLVLRIKNINTNTKEVQLSVYADAEVRLSALSPILDVVKLAGMLPEEAENYLKSFDAIEDVEVNLFPSWQKRIPTIPDRIKMVIKK